MLSFKTVNRAVVIIFFGLILGAIFLNVPLWLFIILGFIWLVITISGSGLIGWNYHFNSLINNPSIKENQIAITFDDGPHPEFTPHVLEILERYNAKATFFCIGKNIESHPEIFNSILKKGHTVGNHTFSHSNSFGFFKTDKVLSELQKTNTLVKEKTGKDMLLYRPAFGVTNPRIKKAIKRLELQSVGWNIRSLDTTNRNSKTVLNRITKNLKKGDVVLLHDTSSKSVDVLEQLLLFLQQKKIESVTIDSLFKIKPYA